MPPSPPWEQQKRCPPLVGEGVPMAGRAGAAHKKGGLGGAVDSAGEGWPSPSAAGLQKRSTAPATPPPLVRNSGQ